jgi:hypothetical protein
VAAFLTLSRHQLPSRPIRPSPRSRPWGLGIPRPSGRAHGIGAPGAARTERVPSSPASPPSRLISASQSMSPGPGSTKAQVAERKALLRPVERLRRVRASAARRGGHAPRRTQTERRLRTRPPPATELLRRRANVKTIPLRHAADCRAPCGRSPSFYGAFFSKRWQGPAMTPSRALFCAYRRSGTSNSARRAVLSSCVRTVAGAHASGLLGSRDLTA